MKPYKKLEHFRDIFGREDFDYIVSAADGISSLIKYGVKVSPKADKSDCREEEYDRKIGEFYANLSSFCNWLHSSSEEINKGLNLCDTQLFSIRKLLREPLLKRKAISGGYINKFNKTFLYSLSLIYRGISASFDPLRFSATGINKVQLAKYLLDKRVGYGQFFEFNKHGSYAAADHIFDAAFTKEHMIETLRVLKLKEFREKPYEFECWGNGRVRIHLAKKFFGKTRIYRIYRADTNTEHARHVRDLRTKVAASIFAAA